MPCQKFSAKYVHGPRQKHKKKGGLSAALSQMTLFYFAASTFAFTAKTSLSVGAIFKALST
jgi:hypothetical protein